MVCVTRQSCVGDTRFASRGPALDLATNRGMAYRVKTDVSPGAKRGIPVLLIALPFGKLGGPSSWKTRTRARSSVSAGAGLDWKPGIRRRARALSRDRRGVSGSRWHLHGGRHAYGGRPGGTTMAIDTAKGGTIPVYRHREGGPRLVSQPLRPNVQRHIRDGPNVNVPLWRTETRRYVHGGA